MKKCFFLSFYFLTVLVYSQKDSTFVIDSLTPNLSYVIFNEGDYISSILVSQGKDGVVFFDNGCDNNFNGIMNCFGGQEKLKTLILTHWHFDHTMGNKRISNKSVDIIATEKTAYYLSHNEKLLGTSFKPNPKRQRPNRILKEITSIIINDDSIVLIPVQGHTDGDLLVYFPKLKILHVGDLIFSDMFAFYDIAHGGDVNDALMVLNRIRNNFPEDIKIIPSHGRYYTMSDLSSYIIMLEGVIKAVISASANGLELDEMKEKNLLSPWKDYAKAFSCNDMLEFVYQSHMKIK